MSAMAAGYPEQNPPSFTEERTPFMENIAALDMARDGYLAACDNYASKPVNKNGLALNVTASGYANAFIRCLDSLREDTSDTKVIVRDITAFIKSEDNLYVGHLNSLMGSRVATPLDISVTDLDEAVEEALELVDTPDEALDAATEQFGYLFGRGLEADTQKFIDKVGESKTAKRVRLQKSIGKHAVDIGKMTLGVASGILLTRFLGKRPNHGT